MYELFYEVLSIKKQKIKCYYYHRSVGMNCLKTARFLFEFCVVTPVDKLEIDLNFKSKFIYPKY